MKVTERRVAPPPQHHQHLTTDDPFSPPGRPSRRPEARQSAARCAPHAHSAIALTARPLAARLVEVLARADLADLAAHVVGELEVLLGDEALALGLGSLRVLLRLRAEVGALGGQVGGVDVAVGKEDRHAVLRLALGELELLQERAEARALLLNVLGGRVVGARRERAHKVGTLRRLGRLAGLRAAAAAEHLDRRRRRNRGARQLVDRGRRHECRSGANADSHDNLGHHF
mmetsp:Transcript_53662/g.138716  ORF Transcript_53662/g.138716 Transcript_53662/m.138716 type:complete len:230 (+) Transcript_53662:197-886(+)